MDFDLGVYTLGIGDYRIGFSVIPSPEDDATTGVVDGGGGVVFRGGGGVVLLPLAPAVFPASPPAPVASPALAGRFVMAFFPSLRVLPDRDRVCA